MMTRSLFFLALFISLLSCEDKFSVTHSASLAARSSIRRNDTIMKDTVNDLYFSRLSDRGSFGMIYTYFPPDEVKDKLLEVVVSGKIRTNYAHSNAAVIVSVGSKNNVQLVWTGRNLRYYFTDINTWCPFKDSVIMQHESWQEPYYRIDVFAYLPGPSAEKFDIDSLHVKVKVKQ